jgi:hypothetical protein
MHKRRPDWFFGVLALLVTAAPATACCGPQWNTVTLLDSLPPMAESHQVIARVEVIELLKPQLPQWGTDSWVYTNLIKVRVVEPIKGVHLGQIFTVDTRGSDCDQILYNSSEAKAQMVDWRPYVVANLKAPIPGLSCAAYGTHGP